jgi:hypothetical protein
MYPQFFFLTNKNCCKKVYHVKDSKSKKPTKKIPIFISKFS